MIYYLNNNYFFVTCRTVDARKYFSKENTRAYILSLFKRVEKDFNVKFTDYSILLNHYHFLLPLKDGKVLGKITNLINGNVSRYLKESPKPLWGDYHNSNVFNKASFYRVLGYIAGNPFKHGLVKSIEDLALYPYSNYFELADIFGRDGINEIICKVKSLNWDLKM